MPGVYRPAAIGVNGRADNRWVPRIGQGLDRRPVIYCHGSSSTVEAITTTGGQSALFQRISDLGYVVFASRMGANLANWGNAEFVAELTAALAYIDTLGYRSTKVHIVGASQGFDGALLWAAQNPTRVASLVGLIPACDPQAGRAADVAIRAAVDAAWSVTYPAAMPAGSTPQEHLAALAAFPTLLVRSTSDPSWLYDTAQTYAEAVDATLVDVTVAHDDTGLGQISARTVTDFLALHDAA